MSFQVAHYFRISPDCELPSISSFRPHKAVVVLAAEYPKAWQNTVSDWLVASGCRYMMAWGPDCSSWDDSVDWASLEATDFKDDESKFVMTTWHNDETLEGVFWFSQFCAGFSFDDLELRDTLLIDVSNVDRESELLALFERSRDLAEREDEGNQTN